MGGGDLQKYNFLSVVYQRVVIPKKIWNLVGYGLVSCLLNSPLSEYSNISYWNEFHIYLNFNAFVPNAHFLYLQKLVNRRFSDVFKG